MARLALIKQAELVVFQREDAVGSRFEVVEQSQRIELERAPQFAAVDHPGKIGSFDFAVDHRPGDAEAGGVDGVRAPGGEKFLQHRYETRIPLARKALRPLRAEPFTVNGKKRDVSLRPANVAGED